MPYRRYPGRYRRYPGPVPGTHIHSDTVAEQPVAPVEAPPIPLPNEPELPEPPPSEMRGEKRRNGPSKLLDVFSELQKHIGLEEIILLGLIFILLQEGIEDDLLLLMLIYILID